ncbi:PREDICTED: uncharacterized protein LOC109153201 [Ipomoea nil]|uniref:uncharacterized protein LOC109153201 n=1 Tax=Ipomoea nil TaxID=35883 RepID=UPI0009011E27|nr:PREDICTED: uncharacterized protein LOC109153201 [Ipomoea nil]
MDINQLERQCADLSLATEEAGGLEAPESQTMPDETIQNNLIGRFLTNRPIRFDHMQHTMASVWRPVMGMFDIPLADDLFLFQFPHPRDLQRVIDDGPWSFDNYLLLCEPVPPGIRPEEIELNSALYWVQIHGLPSMFASQEFLAKIGDYVGSYVVADPHNFGGNWKSHYRIRVRMTMTTPLKRRMKLLRRDGSSQWITFKYERLGTFCYCCGVMGHSDKFCKTVYEEGILPEAFPFGTWMRAGPRRQVKPVGAKWLLSSSTPAEPTMNTLAAGPPPAMIVAMENTAGLQGDLKRRREEDEAVGTKSDIDVLMTDTLKQKETVSLDGQARREQ